MFKRVIALMMTFAMLIPTIAFAEGETALPEEEMLIEQNEPTEPTSPETEPTEPEEELEQPETKDEEVTKEESIIENARIIARDTTSCSVKWDSSNNQPVTLHYTYGDTDKTVVVTNSQYRLTEIPFGSTVNVVLTTDETHKEIELACNPSDDFTPIEVGDIPEKPYSNTQKGYNYYCKGMNVYTKSGNIVYNSYYTVEGLDKIKSSGVYPLTIKFKGRYENYKPLSFKLKVIPPTPSVVYNPINGEEHSVIFMVRVTEELCDNYIAEIATSPEFKKPIVKKIKPKKANIFVQFTIPNLRENTLYYVRVRAVKTINNQSLYSKPCIVEICTTEKMPAYFQNQRDVKNIISLMKRNKKFEYNFNHNYNVYKVYDFVAKIDNDFPQYSGRYNRVTNYNEKSVSIIYTPSSQMKNYTKATAAINKIVKATKKKKGVRNKVKYIDKKLCKTCSYDYDTYKRTKKRNLNAYNLTGVFIRHKAVCMGYAEAFHAICVQCGIQDQYIRKNNHIWNIVKVGKRWYHVDVTWNDSTHSKRYLLKKSHR